MAQRVGWPSQPSLLHPDKLQHVTNVILLLCTCLFFVYIALIAAYAGTPLNDKTNELLEAAHYV